MEPTSPKGSVAASPGIPTVRRQGFRVEGFFSGLGLKGSLRAYLGFRVEGCLGFRV